MTDTARHFTGVVENINVKGSGPSSAQLLFGLRADNGEKKPFVVQIDSEARVFAAMTTLLTTAMQYSLYVHVTYDATKPTSKVSEIEIRRD